MFTWAKLVLTALSVISSLIAYMRERKLIKAAEDRLLKEILQEQLRLIDNADNTRKEAAARNAGVPASDSLPNDGYRRD